MTSRDEDVVGADGQCAASPSLSKALEVVYSVTAEAQRLECEGVTRVDIARLAQGGVLSAGLVPGWTPAQYRELQERLAAASGAAWFVVAQHHSPALAARSTESELLRARYEAGLASGELLGAVSFAHLRRPRPTVVADRDGDGWLISGRLDWITSWGLADVLLLMAETADGRVVQSLIEPVERPGLLVTGELSLAAMSGTSTVGAVLDGLRVTDAEVAALVAKSEWAAADAQRTANATPAVAGLARAAVNSIHSLAEQRQWSEAQALAAQWREELVELRGRAYQLMDDVDPAERLPERHALRAQLTLLARDATSMAIAVHAGRAMITSSPEQRWAREALFALVHAQTPVSRNALIASSGHSSEVE